LQKNATVRSYRYCEAENQRRRECDKRLGLRMMKPRDFCSHTDKGMEVPDNSFDKRVVNEASRDTWSKREAQVGVIDVVRDHQGKPSHTVRYSNTARRCMTSMRETTVEERGDREKRRVCYACRRRGHEATHCDLLHRSGTTYFGGGEAC
jgi:hypothetical protein